MKRTIFFLLVFFSAAIMISQTNATLVSVNGPNSSVGTAPQIIAAPSDILEDFVVNSGMEGFDEAQGVLTTVAHTHDTGVIPVGTRVNSHMIFLNSEGTTGVSHDEVVWTFANQILAVMSDIGGTYEAASTFELGAAATNYTIPFGGSGDPAPYGGRGLDLEDDSYLVSGNQITVSMTVWEPGDWMRVITMPEPATLCFLLVSGLGLLRYRRTGQAGSV